MDFEDILALLKPGQMHLLWLLCVAVPGIVTSVYQGWQPFCAGQEVFLLCLAFSAVGVFDLIYNYRPIRVAGNNVLVPKVNITSQRLMSLVRLAEALAAAGFTGCVILAYLMGKNPKLDLGPVDFRQIVPVLIAIFSFVAFCVAHGIRDVVYDQIGLRS